ncbi:MAG: hypothetical protein ACLP9L_03575 [Thermoguttaceae bacterium]
MKLQRREKILAGLALGLVALAGLWFLLFAGDSLSDDQLIKKQDELTSKIEDDQKLLDVAARDAKRLADWKRRSLPSDPVRARSLYQNWLGSLADRNNFRDKNLGSNDLGARHDQNQNTKISFTLRAQAKLGDLVQFMHEFYSAGLLHQIRRLNIKPNKNTSDLTVDLSIEAYSLPTAESKTELPKVAGHGLQLAKSSDYRDPIVKRDFFAPYVRPSPTPRPRENMVDAANFAFVTGFTEVDGSRKVWLQDRMGGKSWQLATGESFTVGNMKGTVQSIHPEGEVVVDFDGRRRLLHDGDNLHGGVVVKDQRPTQAEENDDSDSSDSDEDN